MKLEKVYVVEFMKYTNCMNDTVSDWDGVSDTLKTSKYLDIGKEPFLVRESDLPKYQKFGGGYRTVNFIGNIEINNETPKIYPTVSEYADIHSTGYDPKKEQMYEVITTC